MYCPECRSEYREGFTECVDCGVPLVSSLPVSEHPRDVNLVTVFDGTDPGALAMAESLLVEAGIPYLKDGELAHAYIGAAGILNPLLGPLRVQVPEEHAADAFKLLEELRPEVAVELDRSPEPE